MIRAFQKRSVVLFITILSLIIFNASLSFSGQYKVTRVIDGVLTSGLDLTTYGTETQLSEAIAKRIKG